MWGRGEDGDRKLLLDFVWLKRNEGAAVLTKKKGEEKRREKRRS